MSEKKVIVVGTGSAGMRHLKLLKSISGVHPIAVPKRTERQEELKREGFSVAANLQEALANNPRYCIVASDTASHISDASMALQAGCDVLVEKPLSYDVASTNSLKQTVVANKAQVFVGCNLRFSESLLKFRELLPQIGKAHSIRVECQSYLPDWRPNRDYRQSYSARPREGGVLLDLIHEIDYTGWIFGWPTKVKGNLKNFGILNIETEESADLSWETPSGVSVSMTLDYLSRIPRRFLRAFGEKGVLEWNGIANRVTLEKPSEKVSIFESKQTREEMTRDQLEAFLNQPMKNQLATLDEALKALTICDAARIH